MGLRMSKLLRELKHRRLELGLKQEDMQLRAGISRQQYQQLESKGNPRLSTLELVAKGLSSELVLVPKERLSQVRAVLSGARQAESTRTTPTPTDDPWQGMLGDDD